MFWGSFPTNSVVWLFSKLPFGSKLRKFEVEVSNRCKMLRTEAGNDLFSATNGLMLLGQSSLWFLKGITCIGTDAASCYDIIGL